MNNLIALAQVIGSGLSNQNCYLSLQKVGHECGTFWAYRGDSKSGIWCSERDWAAGIETQFSSSTVPDDLIPTMVAALFSVVNIPFVRDINIKGEACSLPSDIYPVVQCDGYQFVLVGFSATWIKHLTMGWESYFAPQIRVKVPLVVGYLTHTQPVFDGGGVWLKEGHDPNLGTAILWWEKPVASVQHQAENTWSVTNLYASYSLSDDVSYVQIATLDLSLQDLYQLENNYSFEAELSCEVQSKLISNNACVAKGDLLVSPDGVVFYADKDHIT